RCFGFKSVKVYLFFFFQAEDGIRSRNVTGVQTCALPIYPQYIYQFLNMPMPDEIIDFSVNLNPLGPPSRIKEKWSDWLPLIEDYPDPHGSALVERILHQEGLTNEQIILGNGGADIIRLLANMFSRQRVLLIQPTFAEYERMCRAYGCDISHFVLSEGEWRISLEALIPKLAKHDVV